MEWEKLIESLLWPATVVYALCAFRAPIKRLIESLAERDVVIGWKKDVKIQLKKLSKEIVTLAKESPDVPTSSKVSKLTKQTAGNVDDALWNSDPNKEQWGGSSIDRAHHVRVRANKVRSLSADRDYFWVPLIVESTDPKQPLVEGTPVTFHLHPTFDPDKVTVKVKNGVATKTLLANAGFTVGVEIPKDIKLELDLCSAEVDAPRRFKEG
jgi:hypothetical protein